MATFGRNLADGSRYCRDCGGPTVRGGRLATCDNVADGGQQQTAQDVCSLLPPERRRYCERCGASDPGPGICPGCNESPLRGS